jgi:sensor histidine kinase regulating citrate/malate metabolism
MRQGKFNPRYPVLFLAMSAVIVTLVVMIVLVFLYANEVKNENEHLREASCKLADWIASSPPRRDVPDFQQYINGREDLINSLNRLSNCA